MKRPIVTPQGLKDESGAYTKVTYISLDDILEKQLLALTRVTKQLTEKSVSLNMTKDEIQSLAACIKITMELKAKEKELLDSLSDEELAALVRKDDQRQEG